MRRRQPLLAFARSHTRRAGLTALAAIVLALLLVVGAQAQETQEAPAPTADPPAAAAEAALPAPPGFEVEALARVLEDDAARARLLEALRAAAPAEAAAEADYVPFARRIAERTRAVAEDVAALFAVSGRAVDLAAALWRDMSLVDLERAARVFGHLAVVVGATLLAYAALRLAAAAFGARLAGRARGRGVLRRVALSAGGIGAEAGAVGLSWVIGYAVAVNAGATGLVSLNQSLFLNAFLVAEGTKLAARALLKPRLPDLRLLPIGDTAAAYWYFWIARATSILAYAFLFLAPIAVWSVSWTAGEAVRAFAVLCACAIGVLVTLQNKEAVRALLVRRSANGKGDALAAVGAGLARVWHVVAIVYFVAVFFVWLARPRGGLSFMLSATVESLIAIVVGLGIAGLLSRAISGGMRLSEDVRQRLPLLEARLNAFVPRVLQALRLVVLAGVAIAVAQAWGLVDFIAWASSGVGLAVTTSLLSAGLLVLVGIALHIAVSSWVEYRLNPDFGAPPSARERTLLSLFRNAFTVALVVVVSIMVLAELGLNVGPLLAGAGVVGLAVGFGAQKLVQDVITGVFIQLENAMNEGDVVSAGGVTGVVERLTIRSVSMRDVNGVYHVIPFSSVGMVSNMMRHFSYYVADVGVAYRESIPEVKRAMQDAYDLLAKSPEHGSNLIGPFEMMGVEAFRDSAVVVRGRLKTLPGKQWATGRAYNEILKQVFDERGIEIPFPHLTVYAGVGKSGEAPPLRVVAEPAPEPEGRRGPTKRETLASVGHNAADAPEESGARG